PQEDARGVVRRSHGRRPAAGLMLRGTLLIARLTWLETRRRRIALAALIAGLLFVAVFATGMYFGFRAARLEGAVNAVELRIAATILTVAGLYVVNFLVVA